MSYKQFWEFNYASFLQLTTFFNFTPHYLPVFPPKLFVLNLLCTPFLPSLLLHLSVSFILFNIINFYTLIWMVIKTNCTTWLSASLIAKCILCFINNGVLLTVKMAYIHNPYSADQSTEILIIAFLSKYLQLSALTLLYLTMWNSTTYFSVNQYSALTLYSKWCFPTLLQLSFYLWPTWRGCVRQSLSSAYIFSSLKA